MKSFVIHIIVIAVAIVCGSYLARDLHQRQQRIAPTRSEVSAAPLGGFHKMASDIKWMLLINYLGSQNSINKENREEVAKRLDTLLSYDPNFEKAYELGALSLSVADPQKAVDILHKACNNEYLKKNWKIPSYAGFILVHHDKTGQQTGDNAQKKEARRKAIQNAIPYLKMAIERSPEKQPYLINSYVRAKAMAEDMDNVKYATLKVLFDEWKNKNTGGGEEADEIEGEILIPDIEKRLLVAAKEAKEEKPGDKKVQALVDEVMNKVFKDRHICPGCLTPYGPGEKYCSSCGMVVESYGICPECHTVMKGKFCSNCGYPGKNKSAEKDKK